MKLKVWELCTLSLFGAVMFVSKLLLEFLPNVHLIAMFIILVTLLFRAKALISIYTFVILTGIYGGFSLWWVPYLYIWTVLWVVIMLLPRKMSIDVAMVVYSAVAGLHGILFGALYAPFQALAFGLSFKATIAWIIAGIPFDLIHGVSNAHVALLVLPLYIPLKKVISKFN